MGSCNLTSSWVLLSAPIGHLAQSENTLSHGAQYTPGPSIPDMSSESALEGRQHEYMGRRTSKEGNAVSMRLFLFEKAVVCHFRSEVFTTMCLRQQWIMDAPSVTGSCSVFFLFRSFLAEVSYCQWLVILLPLTCTQFPVSSTYDATGSSVSFGSPELGIWIS